MSFTDLNHGLARLDKGLCNLYVAAWRLCQAPGGETQ